MSSSRDKNIKLVLLQLHSGEDRPKDNLNLEENFKERESCENQKKDLKKCLKLDVDFEVSEPAISNLPKDLKMEAADFKVAYAKCMDIVMKLKQIPKPTKLELEDLNELKQMMKNLSSSNKIDIKDEEENSLSSTMPVDSNKLSDVEETSVKQLCDEDMDGETFAMEGQALQKDIMNLAAKLADKYTIELGESTLTNVEKDVSIVEIRSPSMDNKHLSEADFGQGMAWEKDVDHLSHDVSNLDSKSNEDSVSEEFVKDLQHSGTEKEEVPEKGMLELNSIKPGNSYLNYPRDEDLEKTKSSVGSMPVDLAWQELPDDGELLRDSFLEESLLEILDQETSSFPLAEAIEQGTVGQGIKPSEQSVRSGETFDSWKTSMHSSLFELHSLRFECSTRCVGHKLKDVDLEQGDVEEMTWNWLALENKDKHPSFQCNVFTSIGSFYEISRELNMDSARVLSVHTIMYDHNMLASLGRVKCESKFISLYSVPRRPVGSFALEQDHRAENLLAENKLKNNRHDVQKGRKRQLHTISAGHNLLTNGSCRATKMSKRRVKEKYRWSKSQTEFFHKGKAKGRTKAAIKHGFTKFRGCAGRQASGRQGQGRGGRGSSSRGAGDSRGSQARSCAGSSQSGQHSSLGSAGGGEDPEDNMGRDLPRGYSIYSAYGTAEEGEKELQDNTKEKYPSKQPSHQDQAPTGSESSPNLPKVEWDPLTLAKREYQLAQGNSQNTVAAYAHPAEVLPLPSHAQVFTGGGGGRSSEHATISPTQLCEIIGYVALNGHVPPDLFSSFDQCLAKAMHDLSFSLHESCDGPNHTLHGASNANGNSTSAVCSPVVCTVCLLVSGLLGHLSQPVHENPCPQCDQVLALMTQHGQECVLTRSHQSISSADLCYKICKRAGWSADKINCATFRGKIRKYCDKVLGKSNTKGSNSQSSQSDGVGMGEMGVDAVALPSPSLSTGSQVASGGSTYPSIFGKPITTESEGPSCASQYSPSYMSDRERTLPGLDSAPSSGFSALASSDGSPRTGVGVVHPHISSSSSGTLTQNAAVAVAVSPASQRKAHNNLVRKGSQKLPAIPQPIVEESPSDPAGASKASQDDSALMDVMRTRFMQGPKGTDPYDTQRTFGDSKGYASMPQGDLHDQSEFYSFHNRPVGVPGIGEVVIGNHSQLKVVTRFWENKRRECEESQTVPPYQHREEGVMLTHHKEHFSVLRTRYQKHHQWEKVAHLGNGMSGKCHLVMDLKTDFKFCCKKVHLLRFSAQEITLWSELRHPFIVKLYGAIRHGVKIYIFCELIDGGSLAVCIEEQKRLGQRLSHWSAINYFQQLLKVLSYLQTKNVLHEDIKADNILLRRDSQYIAVTDFGMSVRVCDPRELRGRSPQGSPAHWSPEKVMGQGHGFPADLWAAVCVLIHMLSGDPPWMKRFAQTATTLCYIIFSRDPPLEDVPANVQPIVKSLISQGLVKDPEKRPSPNELLSHEAFKILENVKPETYFSSLVSQSRATLLQQPDVEASSVADIESSGSCNILYIADTEANQAGPLGANVEPTCNTQAEAKAIEENTQVTQKPETTMRSSHADFQSDQGLDPVACEACAQDVDISEPEVKVEETKGKAKSRAEEILQIPDLATLLESLPVSEESKAFYNDVVPNSTTALINSSAKQQRLPRFRPLPQSSSNVPNLSIFALSMSGSDGRSSSDVTVTSGPNAAQSAMAAQPSEFANDERPCALRLASTHKSSRLADFSNAISFMLSSESDDYLSIDIFEAPAPPVAEVENIEQERAGKGSHSGLYQLETSRTEESMASVSVAGTSNPKQRKPYDFKLDLSPPPPGDNAPAPAGVFGLGSANGSGATPGLGSAHLVRPRTTPSTGKLSSSSSKVASSGSTAASPWFSSADVFQEQEKLLQQYREKNSLSSSGSDILADQLDDPQSAQVAEAHVEKARSGPKFSGREALNKLQKTGLSRPLAGHGLRIYDEITKDLLFTVRFMEPPVTKKQLVLQVSDQLAKRYSHFHLLNMDHSPLRLDVPLEVHEILVRALDQEERGCLCENCRRQF